jgi:hypothetical protein
LVDYARVNLCSDAMDYDNDQQIERVSSCMEEKSNKSKSICGARDMTRLYIINSKQVMTKENQTVMGII